MLTFAANAANVLITTTYETDNAAIGIENNVYNMFNSIAGNDLKLIQMGLVCFH